MSGAILWSADYDAFGKATIGQQSVVSNLRFPGQYFDGETGLHYNYYRYYDLSNGFYITLDPIGLAGGVNSYVYGLNNPIKFADPEGKIALTTILLVVTAARLGLAAADFLIDAYYSHKIMNDMHKIDALKQKMQNQTNGLDNSNYDFNQPQSCALRHAADSTDKGGDLLDEIPTPGYIPKLKVLKNIDTTSGNNPRYPIFDSDSPYSVGLGYTR